MNKKVEIILDEARKLTPAEREELLARLEHELADEAAGAETHEDEGTTEEGEAALVTTANTRAAQIDRGEVVMVPWEDVLTELRRR